MPQYMFLLYNDPNWYQETKRRKKCRRLLKSTWHGRRSPS